MDHEPLPLSEAAATEKHEDVFNNPNNYYVFYELKGLPKSFNFSQGNLEKPPQIPDNAQPLAEISLLESFDQNDNQRRYLKIDLSKPENTGDIIRTIINWYLGNSNEQNREGLWVLINIIGKGHVKLPLNSFNNPTSNLNNFIDNLPSILERREIRYFVRRALEEVKKEDSFLELLYDSQQDLQKIIQYIKQKLSNYYHFDTNRYSEQSLLYLDTFIKKVLTKYNNLKQRFSSNLHEILKLSEDEIYQRLADFPAIFLPEILIKHPSFWSERKVPVSKIITAQAKETGTEGKNWADYLIRRTNQYMRDFMRVVLRGDLDLNNSSIEHGYNLLDLGNGFFMVLNGRHRTAVAKILGMKTIKARVFNLLPKIGEKRYVPPDFVDVLRERIKNGLIQGHLEQDASGSWQIQIYGYQGWWVFYQNMEEAKKLFFEIIKSLSPSDKV